MPSISLDFNHDFEIEAPPVLVWKFLWDIQAMAGCIPGCEEVITQVENKTYLAKMRRKVGPFVIRMEMDIEVTECVEPERVAVVVAGRDNKLKSKLSQTLNVSLSGEPEGPSRVEIHTQFELSGVLAALGATLLKGHVKHEMDTFVKNVQTGIEEFKAQQAT
jgi:carbon monoxide dehydrogenase subunit G